MDDWRLLRDYADHGAEAAFTELVRRHADLVYSTALRKLSDPHAAEEAAQAVFSLLAQKAPALPAGVSVPGWLYQTTCYKAGEYLRNERRRRAREENPAVMENLLPGHSPEADTAWTSFGPMLDDAMQELSDTDRLAILLRFFQRKPLRDIGGVLGLDEDAARKRVSRALDKLRAWFANRGVVCPAAAVAAALTTHAVKAAPAGFAEAAAATALGISTLATSTSFLVPAAKMTTLMSASKTPLIVAGIAAVLLAIPVVKQWHTVRTLQQEQESLRRQAAEAERLRAENIRLQGLQVDFAELARLRAERSELLRLRGEVNQLRQQAAVVTNKSEADAPPAKTEPAVDPLTPYTATLHAVVANGHTLITGGWEINPGKRIIALVTPTIDSSNPTGNNVLLKSQFIEASEDAWRSVGLDDFKSDSRDSNQSRVLAPAEISNLVKQLEKTGNADILSTPTVSTLNGREAAISIGDGQTGLGPDGKPIFSPAINFIPRLTEDGQSFDLTMLAQMKPAQWPAKNLTGQQPQPLQSPQP